MESNSMEKMKLDVERNSQQAKELDMESDLIDTI